VQVRFAVGRDHRQMAPSDHRHASGVDLGGASSREHRLSALGSSPSPRA